MTKEKQIEEMLNEVCIDCKHLVRCSDELKKVCAFRKGAEVIYNAGYRKQSEGEWVFEHEYYGKMLCSNCNGEALVNECSEYVDSDFCPNCGAKMKGGE